ncbi:hypothetical protein Pfo_008047, partial [Paulownia fortunei]
EEPTDNQVKEIKRGKQPVHDDGVGASKITELWIEKPPQSQIDADKPPIQASKETVIADPIAVHLLHKGIDPIIDVADDLIATELIGKDNEGIRDDSGRRLIITEVAVEMTVLKEMIPLIQFVGRKRLWLR